MQTLHSSQAQEESKEQSLSVRLTFKRLHYLPACDGEGAGSHS